MKQLLSLGIAAAISSLFMTGCAESLPVTPENAPKKSASYDGCLVESYGALADKEWEEAYIFNQRTDSPKCKSVKKDNDEHAQHVTVSVNGMDAKVKYSDIACSADLKLTAIDLEDEEKGIKTYYYAGKIAGDDLECAANHSYRNNIAFSIESKENGGLPENFTFSTSVYKVPLPHDEVYKTLPDIYKFTGWGENLPKGQIVEFNPKRWPKNHPSPAKATLVSKASALGGFAHAERKTEVRLTKEENLGYLKEDAFGVKVASEGILKKIN